MDQVASTTRRSHAKQLAEIDDMVIAMRRLNDQMDKDRRAIDGIRAESRALRAETQRLKEETRTILARLETKA